MSLESLTKEEVEGMSNEEIILNFQLLKQQEEIRVMKKQLLHHIEVREAESD